VAATRTGDDRAFERLYQRYQRRIAAYVFGMVKDHGRAEDITQEVFISALRRMRETERPIIFKPWIYEIAKNACIDAFRRSRRAEEISYDADGGLGPSDHGRLVSKTPTPDAAVDTRMSLDHLRGAFGGLSETHHDILVMRELEGLSYREIGQRLGMSRPSVESTLFRARRRLTEEYEELTSGERCVRVQALIVETDGRRMGVRQERQLARHVSYCQPCRRAAYAAGLDVAALAERKSLRSKIAAVLPIPAFVRRWFGGDRDQGDPGGGAVARWSTTASQYAEPASGWVKAAAVAATVAVAGVGTGVGVTQGTSKPGSPPQIPSAAPAGGSSAGSGSASQAGGAAGTAGAAKTVGAAASSTTRGGAAAKRSGAAGRGGAAAGDKAPARDGGGSAGGGGGGGGGAGAGGKASGSTGSRSGGSAVGGAADRASGTVDKTGDAVRKTVDGTKKTVSTTTKKATDTVKDTVRDTTNQVDKATNNATKPVSDAVNGAVNTATGAVNTATGAAGGAIPSDPVGTVTNSLPSVPTPSVSVPAPSVPSPPPVNVPSVSVPTSPVSVPTPTLPIGPGG
jgi:RNA polymerase sigma factor (sigma-70 family)